MTESYLTLKDLSHDSKLASALGNMVVAWAHAENILLQVISRVTGIGQNMALTGYYHIPTFESRTKFILAIVSEWETEHYDKDTITKTIEKLGKLASARNHWIHGDWCTNKDKDYHGYFQPSRAGNLIGETKAGQRNGRFEPL